MNPIQNARNVGNIKIGKHLRIGLEIKRLFIAAADGRFFFFLINLHPLFYDIKYGESAYALPSIIFFDY